MQLRTIIDRIEIEPQTGNVGVRMRKQIIADDGKTVLGEQYHRTMIDAATDPAAQMAAVNEHLAQTGFPAVKADDRAVLNAVMPTLTNLRAAKAEEAKNAIDVRSKL